MAKVREILNVLDVANLQITVEEGKFAKSQIEWFGFESPNSGLSPVNNKVQSITERLRPTKLKELRLDVGAVNQINKFIPDLAAERLRRKQTRIRRSFTTK